MKRTAKVSTSVTPDEKGDFRVLAAERDMDMAELLRELVYDELEAEGYETSRGEQSGNQRLPAMTAD